MTPGALPAVTVPSFLNAGFSAASVSAVVSARIAFVAVDHERVAFLLRNRDRQDLVFERAFAGRARGLLMTSRRIVVLRGAADVVVLGDDLARVAHVALLEGAPQAVVDHRVDDLAVAHPQAVAHARQQVRTVAHRLHPAGHGDVDVADADRLIGDHHGLEPGAAHLVDGQRGDVIRQSAVERGLARRILAQPGADDVAHDAFVDDLRVDARAADGFGDRQRAELRRGEALERAEELARRRSDGGHDHGFTHSRAQASGLRTRAGRFPVRQTSMRSTTPAPSSDCRRRKMTGDERITSFDHCGARGLDEQDALLELDVGDALERGADRRLPRERHLGVAQRRAAQELDEGAGESGGERKHGHD